MEPGGLDLIMPSMGELLPGLLFAAIPLIASIAIAARHGGPIWLAALLALVLSWLGLVIVAIYYYGFGPFRGELSDRTESEPEDGSITRLRTLNRLLAEGLIDREEYERKRLEVLERV